MQQPFANINLEAKKNTNGGTPPDAVPSALTDQDRREIGEMLRYAVKQLPPEEPKKPRIDINLKFFGLHVAVRL